MRFRLFMILVNHGCWQCTEYVLLHCLCGQAELVTFAKPYLIGDFKIVAHMVKMHPCEDRVRPIGC